MSKQSKVNTIVTCISIAVTTASIALTAMVLMR